MQDKERWSYYSQGFGYEFTLLAASLFPLQIHIVKSFGFGFRCKSYFYLFFFSLNLICFNVFMLDSREIHWNVLSSKTCHRHMSLLYLCNDHRRHVYHSCQVLRLKTLVKWLFKSLLQALETSLFLSFSEERDSSYICVLLFKRTLQKSRWRDVTHLSSLADTAALDHVLKVFLVPKRPGSI